MTLMTRRKPKEAELRGTQSVKAAAAEARPRVAERRSRECIVGCEGGVEVRLNERLLKL